jgi:hypothetical protein
VNSKRLALFASVIACFACGGDNGTSSLQDVDTAVPLLGYGNSYPCTKNPSGDLASTDPVYCVEISGNTDIEVAQSSNLQCTAYNINGRVMSATYEWSVSSTTYATLAASGSVATLTGKQGTGTPSSQWVYCLARTGTTPGGVHGTRVLTVRAPVRKVEVSPASVSVAVTKSAALTAVAKDAGGNVLSGKTFTWSSSNTAVATVSASGVVTGVGVGIVSISASADGVVSSAPARVQVTDAPRVVALSVSSEQVQADSTTIISVTGVDQYGTKMLPPPVTLTFTRASAVVVRDTIARFLPQRLYHVRGLLADSVTVTGTVDGVQGQGALVIIPGVTVHGPRATPTAQSYTWTSSVSGCNNGCTYQWIKTFASSTLLFTSDKTQTLSTGPSLTIPVSSTSGFFVGLLVKSNGRENSMFVRVN